MPKFARFPIFCQSAFVMPKAALDPQYWKSTWVRDKLFATINAENIRKNTPTATDINTGTPLRVKHYIIQVRVSAIYEKEKEKEKETQKKKSPRKRPAHGT